MAGGSSRIGFLNPGVDGSEAGIRYTPARKEQEVHLSPEAERVRLYRGGCDEGVFWERVFGNSWSEHVADAAFDHPAILFTMTDRPALQALGLSRREQTASCE